MKMFQPFTLNWWQLGMFKWGVFGCGLLVGAYFSDIVFDFFWVIGFVTLVCIVYVSKLYFQEQK